MSPWSQLRNSVRRELSLGRRRRRSPLPAAAVFLALLGGLGGTAMAQAPYQQEVSAGLSTLDAGSASQPVAADLDGDGDLDLVAGDGDGRLRLFANTGSSAAPSFVERSGAANPFREVLGGYSGGFCFSPDLGDLDGDGDLDVVFGWAPYGGGGSLLRYLENTGTIAAPAFAERQGSANPVAIQIPTTWKFPELADLDGDGDLDLAAGTSYGAFLYFANTGTPHAAAFVERLGSGNPFAAFGLEERGTVTLGDLDADGDLDAVGSDYSGRGRFYANTGSSSAPAFAERTGAANPFGAIDLGTYAAFTLADFDADGDLDAIGGETFGSLRYLANTGTRGAPAFVEPAGPGNLFNGVRLAFAGSPALADLDHDGDLDLVAGEFSGERLRYFANTGSAAVPSYAERKGSADPFPAIPGARSLTPTLGDLDGDGDLDAVAGEEHGRFFYFVNTGSALAPGFAAASGSAHPLAGFDVGSGDLGSDPALVDLDGDGDLDLAAGEQGAAARPLYFENTGSSTQPAFVLVPGSATPFDFLLGQLSLSPDFADLDQDGDFDLLLGGASGGFVLYFENAGDGKNPAFSSAAQPNPFAGVAVGYNSQPELGDLDGDGDLDLLVGDTGGHLVFYRSLVPVFADGFESGDTSAWAFASDPD